MQIHTDGCRKKDGQGGWSYILRHKDKVVVGYGFGINTTSNIMELSGPAMCMDWMLHHNKHKLTAVINSDSTYFVNGFNSWMHNWQRRGWRLKNHAPIKNKLLWEILFEAKQKLDIKAHWVKGHNGHIENEEADAICNFAVITKVNSLQTFNKEGYKQWTKKVIAISKDYTS